MNRRLTLFVFFALCQLFWPLALAQQERLVLVHADALLGKKIGDEEMRQFSGNVEFRQGKARLTCNSATQWQAAGKFVLSGDVAFVDTAKSMFGDTFTYYEATGISYIDGNAKLADSSKTLLAARIRYMEEEKRATADGHVVLFDSTEFVTLTGDHAEYLQDDGYAKVTGNPVLVRTDSTGGDSLIIFGSLFEMFDDGDRFIVTDSVRVRRGEIEAFCDTLEYFEKEERLKLANGPKILQNKQHLTGKAVSLLMNGSDVKAIHIVGDAMVASTVDSSLHVPVPYDLLTGQEMMVYVTDEKIDSVRIDERATSYYHVIDEGEEKGLNKVLGDALFITFDADTLKRVKVVSSPSASAGEFYPPHLRASLESELLEQLSKLKINIETPIDEIEPEPSGLPEEETDTKRLMQEE